MEFTLFVVLLVLFCPSFVLGTAERPPMGWNSWDCYLGSPTESQFYSTAEAFNKLLAPHGYEYLVVDAGWYDINSTTVESDGHSRLIPSFTLWPSGGNGAGFKPIADYVHSMGLKFGIHVMRGIHQSVVEADQPILGTQYTAQDIAIETDQCPWNTKWYGVNMSHPAGAVYYQSLLDLYASWDVDFIKVDCIFSRNYHQQDIMAISAAIQTTGANMVLSLSPGKDTTMEMVQDVYQHVNMYRITQDFWDCWEYGKYYCKWASNVIEHFAMFPQFESMIGAQGLNGSSWPDGDMLPFGLIMDPNNASIPCHPTSLTPSEQYTVMTLWSMFRSPLIFGGDVTNVDTFTLNLLTNDEVLEIQKSSSGNSLSYLDKDNNMTVVQATGANGLKYAAVFNPSETLLSTNFQFSWVGLSGTCFVRDLWAHTNIGSFSAEFPVSVDIHGANLYAISNCN